LCDEDLPYFFQIEGTNNKENPYEVLVNNVWTIILLDLAECREKQRLVDYEAPPENKNYDIEGFSYYSPTQELVFGLVVNPYGDRQYRIMHLDVKSGQQQQLAGEGINPTWSPDGTHIAYIRWDGIYIALSDGSDAKKLVAQQMFDPNEAGTPWINSPIPRWSSDSEWLVYHLCTVKICKLENTEIYKIRVSGGEPERILIGGMDPSWRP
jgi:Tol biopolymer transport system component